MTETETLNQIDEIQNSHMKNADMIARMFTHYGTPMNDCHLWMNVYRMMDSCRRAKQALIMPREGGYGWAYETLDRETRRLMVELQDMVRCNFALKEFIRSHNSVG